uniref:FAD-dependent monooxygenase spdM n=1 Tax=Cordana terrestris TaxID=1293529 RepID=SPDM_CORTS|nr:putative monooxygenase [Cordana terrestris]
MSEDFRVIIVGGSVAGLTLAHSLERLGISFQVLEKNDDISPQIGASIGILPNGARILDQLGLFGAIEKEVEPMKTARISYPDGFTFQSDFPSSWEKSFGYPAAFLERQKFLEILYSKLQHKERVHTGQKVVSICYEKSTVIVKTASGDEYSADLVVGADGVHSTVRSEMWKHMAGVKPGISTASNSSALKLEYACIYGISSQVPEIEAGVWYNLLDKQLTLHFIGVAGGRVFWFLIVKPEKEHWHADRQYLTEDETRRICERLGSKRLSPTLTFGDIWSRCDIFKMTPLEEGWFKTWHFHRLVIMGDAVRKMAPSIGQGANMAIEDAAVLANAIWKAGLGSSKFDTSAMELKIEGVLRHYSTSLRTRTRQMCDRSEFLVRLQTHDGLIKRILARYVIPLLGDVPASLSAKSIQAAPLLEFIDIPARSCQDTRVFSPAQRRWFPCSS